MPPIAHRYKASIVNDKRAHILATAKQLFIEFGIRGTSIQRIADTCGIAKGSIYSYFESKIDIVKAIFVATEEDYHANMRELMANPELTGESLLRTHILLQLELVESDKAFQQMWMSDDSLVMDQDFMEMIQTSRLRQQQAQGEIITQVFGDSVRPWLLDIVITLNGILQEYSVYITLDDIAIDYPSCADYISFVLEKTVSSLPNSNLKAVVSLENLDALETTGSPLWQKAKAKEVLAALHLSIQDLAPKSQEMAAETLKLIETELEQEDWNPTLIRALLANLRDIQEIQSQRAKLANVLDVELV